MAVNQIYLDNSATTRAFPEAINAVCDALDSNYGNPSSAHKMGIRSEIMVSEVRKIIANLIYASEEEIIFTSGGTEANNMAIVGTAYRYKGRGRHLITSTIEHPSVLNTFLRLKKEGFEISFIPVNRHGYLDLNKLEEEIRDDTILVSIMHVNNEIGSVQAIRNLGRILKQHKRPDKPLVYHVDGVQSFTKIPVNVSEFAIDLYSMSSHKIHGPMGCGALFISRDIELSPLFTGGGQENGLRSGTENVPGIAGFGAAVIKNIDMMPEGIDRLFELKNRLRSGLLENIEGIRINGPSIDAPQAPHIVNVSFPGSRAEVLLHALDEAGIYVSTGSACHKTSEPSHVLQALGLTEQQMDGAIRFSISHLNTEEEIDYTIKETTEKYRKLREYF